MEENKQQAEPPFPDASQLHFTRFTRRLTDNTQREKPCTCLTICGVAGVGKSMAARDFSSVERKKKSQQNKKG